MFEFFRTVTDWYMAHINYATITILMAVESSFIPFPSEIVIPPAGYKAAMGELNLILVITCGVAGSIIGAVFNYYVALALGRPIIHKLARTRIAKFLLIDEESVIKAEGFFNKYGRSSTFIGRLLPAVRQLISLPAGLAKMKMTDFLLFSFLGSAIWNAVLAVMGYFLYSQKELLDKYYKELSIAFLALGFLFVLYVILKNVIKPKKKEA